MPARRLHYIDHEGLSTYVARGARVRREKHFSADEQGAEAFAHWLKQGHTRGLHTVFADVADEGFHYETAPHVSGADRHSLIQRKLAQHFFGTPYTAALSLGREAAGRRDDRILFTALTRASALDPWLAALRTAEAAVTGLFTAPLLTQQLLHAARIDAARGLLILLTAAGIRQIYFEDGKLRFARLSPGPEGPFSQWGLDCLRETQKTYQYLSAQRWLPRGTQLPVCLIGHASELPRLMRDLVSTDLLSFQACNIALPMQSLGIRDAAHDSDGRALLMRLALRDYNAPQLAPEADRKFYRLWKLRAGLSAAGIIVFAACALLAGKHVFDARALREDAQQLQRDGNQESIRYNQLLASLPALPSSLESLRSAVDSFELVAKVDSSPRLALVHLSQALDAYPDIDLARLEWRLLNWPGESEDLGPYKPQHALLVTARLPEAAASDPRAAITQIRAFAAALRLQARGEVTLVKLPFDVESDKTLRSEQAVNRQPEFQLTLTLDRPIE